MSRESRLAELPRRPAAPADPRAGYAALVPQRHDPLEERALLGGAERESERVEVVCQVACPDSLPRAYCRCRAKRSAVSSDQYSRAFASPSA